MHTTRQAMGPWLSLLAAAMFHAGTVAASLVQSAEGFPDALLAGPVILAAILFVATAFVVRARPPAASPAAGRAYTGVALAAGIGIIAVFAVTSVETHLLIYALPLGAAVQLAQLARSLSEERVGRALGD